MNDSLQSEIQKRLTMNWLIQGASQHVGMTLHHLIKDELSAINPNLPLWYDQLTLQNQLQWWRPFPTLLFGWPPSWWRMAERSRGHPFYGHPLLARYGGGLAEAARNRALDRAREKGVWRWPFTFSTQNLALIMRIRRCEEKAPAQVIAAASRAAAMAWGIDESLFRPELVFSVTAIRAFGNLRTNRTLRGGLFLASAIAWGGVDRDPDGELCVRASAINGCYLAKELVKGSAELICLHGLSDLDDDTYEQVLHATDRIDFEPPMLQSGGELWRRLLKAVPQKIRPADVLMRLARAENETIVEILSAVIDESAEAKNHIQSLCE